LPVGAAARETPIRPPAPLVLAFAVADENLVSDSEVVASVIEQLRASERVDVLAFSPDLPTVARAVMERRLTRDLVNKASDPQRAVQIASVLGAAYALRIGGLVTTKVTVDLELLKSPGGGRWIASAESDIAEGAGQVKTINRTNAISTAASSAVSQIVILAFGHGGSIQQTWPAVQAASRREALESERTAPRDPAAEYAQIMKQVDAHAAKGDLPSAITELRRAINLKPEEVALRVRLAGMYADLGMSAEAIDECRRALLFSKDDASVYKLLSKLYLDKGALPEAAEQLREIIRLEPQNVDVRLSLGDLYWNLGKVDDAAKEFVEAAKSAPDNPGPHERLYKLFAARNMYGPALEHLAQARLAGGPPGRDKASAYRITARIVEDEFSSVLGKLKSAREDFQFDKIGREAYYSECKDAVNRIEALLDYLTGQTVPREYKDAHSHAVLATSLLAQAGGYLISYLETEKSYYMEQAGLLQSEAATELALYSKAVKGNE